MTQNNNLKTFVEGEIKTLEKAQKGIQNSSDAQYHYYKGQMFAYNRMLRILRKL